MKKKLMVVVCFLMISQGFAFGKSPKKNVQPMKPMKEFIDDLMSRMTLQEKIGQLNLQVAGDIVTGGAVNTDVARKLLPARWVVSST